nr:hypothetical protein [Enterovibrio nigricans]
MLKLDESRLLATFHDANIELTAIEFNLLNLLASEPGASSQDNNSSTTSIKITASLVNGQ